MAQPDDTDTRESQDQVAPIRILTTEELFGECREIWIEHHGERYRLRITRRDKLILQK